MNGRLKLALATSLIALSLSGCGMLGQTGGGGEDRQTGAEADPAAEQGSAPPQDGKSIATKKGTVKGIPFQVDVTGLRRRGKVATLTFKITNKNEGSEELPIWEILKGGEADGLMQWTAGNVTLVDPVNAKRYRYARTGPGDDHKCACTHFESSGAITPGDSHAFFVNYTSPPPDVKKINIEFPTVGVISDVPLG